MQCGVNFYDVDHRARGSFMVSVDKWWVRRPSFIFCGSNYRTSFKCSARKTAPYRRN